ncbi:hypothetical protein FA13DRAFT_1791511 [Coprinellus micaceus]|uniref:Uncharacterized protein n=1 Tax=Coprinellus micaceus TaxID=71717 RepID=A0A4Y7TB44_COPMI|nr:hypothetical protein FA13DRAFT_1791511 [Coprinellus micaceus]
MPPLLHGRDQVLEGVRYYSPNATRDTKLKLQDSPRDNNPFHPESTSLRPTWHDFHAPRPWSFTFGWISFVPNYAFYTLPNNPPFDILSRIPTIVSHTDPQGEVKGYTLQGACEWETLDQDLYEAVLALKLYYNIPMTLPFRPCSFGYTLMYRSKSSLKLKAQLAREWFLVWFGALSYCLAWSKTPSDGMHTHESAKYPEWRTVLERKGLRPDWVDDIENSPIAYYDISNPRAGTIVDILDPVPGQPTIEWLVTAGIEVWYRWSREEEDANWDGKLRMFKPPSTPAAIPVARQSSVQPSRSPTESQLHSDEQVPTPLDGPLNPRTHLPLPDPESGVAGIASTPTPTITTAICDANEQEQRRRWRQEYFSKQRAEDEEIMKRESPYAREARLNRTRVPPTRRVKIFEWHPDGDNPCIYKLHRVPDKAKSDVLFEDYGEQQKIYDPFRNVWHCCSDFGPDDDDDNEEDLPVDAAQEIPIPEDEASTLQAHPPPPPMSESLAQMDRIDDIPAVETVAVPRSPSGLATSVWEMFSKCYGMCDSLPVSPTSSLDAFDDREQSLLLRLACRNEPQDAIDEFKKSQQFVTCLKFFQAMREGNAMVDGGWDLSDDCLLPVRHSPRFATVQKVPIPPSSDELKETYRVADVYYVFTPAKAHTPWKFATLSAAAALLACRLPPHFQFEDIAHYFAQKGIPFRTLYTRPLLPAAPPAFELPYVRPMRTFTYKFTKEDYEGYVRQRVMQLGQSHMQAAIKRGGIAWRLAIGILGISNVCAPPSLWGSYSRVDISEERHSDDLLTSIELDVLCGVYECIDGKFISFLCRLLNDTDP